MQDVKDFPFTKCPFCKREMDVSRSFVGSEGRLLCPDSKQCKSGFYIVMNKDGEVCFFDTNLTVDGIDYNLECADVREPTTYVGPPSTTPSKYFQTNLSKWSYESDGKTECSYYLASPCIIVKHFYHPKPDEEFYIELCRKLLDLLVFT